MSDWGRYPSCEPLCRDDEHTPNCVEHQPITEAPQRRAAGVLSFRGSPVGSVQGGVLCFEGTRIPVSTILAFMEGQDSDAAILDAYASLTQLDLDAARWFAVKWQVRRRRQVPSDDTPQPEPAETSDDASSQPLPNHVTVPGRTLAQDTHHHDRDIP